MKKSIHSNSANVFLNDSTRFYRKSDDSNYGSDLYITTGPDSVLQASETVYYVIPEGKEAGENMTIKAETSQGQSSMGVLVGGMTTTWTYKWTNISPVKGNVAKIANVKGAKAKVKVKKVTDIQKYQIRYKAGNTKNGP